MKSASLSTEFRIIGKEQDSFIESFVGEPLAKIKQSGYFIVIVEVLNKLLEGEAIAESFSETFRKSYYSEEASSDSFTRFEESLKALNKLALQLEHEEGLDLKKVNIAVVALVGTELLVSQCNEAEVYLNRGGVFNVISDNTTDKGGDEDLELFSSISSGKLKEEDQILLSTSRLLRYAGSSQVARCISNKNMDNALADLNSEISAEVLGRLGIIGFSFTGGKSKATSIDAKKILQSQASTLKKMFSSLNFIGESHKRPTKTKPDVELTKASKEPNNSYSEKNLGEFNNTKSNFKNQLASQKVKIGQLVGSTTNLIKENKKTAGIIFFSLIVLVILGSIQAGGVSEKEQLQNVIAQAQSQLEEAKSQTDKQAAATMLANIEAQLKPALDSRLARTDASKLLEQVDEVRFTFDEVVKIEDPSLITDFSKISDYGDPLGFFNLGERIYVYNEKEIVELLLSGVKNPIQIANNNTIRDVAVLDDGAAAYFLLDSNKILEYKDNLAQLIDTDAGSYKPATAIAGFGSRLYSIDNTNQKIWKYTKNRESFSEPEEYLENGELPQSKDVAIDGSIYTITTNNQINRFYLGNKDNFKIDNAPLVSPQNATRIKTNFDSSFVYLLDSANSRIILYYKNQETKNLEYHKQYYFPNLSQITDFHYEEATKKLYVIERDKVYVTTLD